MKEKSAFRKAVNELPNLREMVILDIAEAAHVHRSCVYTWMSRLDRVPRKIFREKILEVMNREKYVQFFGHKSAEDLWPGYDHENGF